MSEYLKKIKIKNLVLKNNLFLSPMAGISNYAFRKICLENGAGLVFSEMISAQSLYRANKKTLNIAKIKDDKPVALQIFGNDRKIMKEASKIACDLGADLLEINASCPVKKITKTGCGVSLMKNLPLLADIVSDISSFIKIPFSVKIRIGIKKGDDLVLKAIPLLENAGIDLLHIHLRVADLIHSGPPDLDLGKKIKEIVKIPLILNGGITNPFIAKEFFEKTKCDAISIGRASVSNPKIFLEIENFLKFSTYETASEKERKKMFLNFLDYNCMELGEEKGIILARKLIGLWLKNFKQASHLRSEFMKTKTLKDVHSLFNF